MTIGNFYSDAGTMAVVTHPTAVNDRADHYVDAVDVRIASVLPVEWLTFQGKADGRSAVLEWSTASEHNSDRFEVERSVDGALFSTIGTVSASGNSTDVRAYSFTDQGYKAPLAYYRLKQVDLDGSFSLSTRIAVTGAEQPGLALQAQDGILEVVYGSGEPFQVTIHDVSGRQVGRWSAGGGVLRVSHGLKGYHVVEVRSVAGEPTRGKVFLP